MNPIAEEQQRRNEQSRHGWDRYAPHRLRVTRLLTEAASPDARLCVLGAGNSNDIDLRALLQAYAELHLVDLDPAALSFGVRQQNCGPTAPIRLYGGVDLTFIMDRLARCAAGTPPTDDELDACAHALIDPRPLDVPGPFDVVASVCVLSQLVQSVEMAIGQRHARFLEMVTRVRAQHLRLLLDLLRPGGRAVLVLDFISSQTCPDLCQIPESGLLDKARELIANHNFFTGVNPAVAARLFASDPALSRSVARVQLTEPWRWDFGPRTYLVCAILVRRRADAA